MWRPGLFGQPDNDERASHADGNADSFVKMTSSANTEVLISFKEAQNYLGLRRRGLPYQLWGSVRDGWFLTVAEVMAVVHCSLDTMINHIKQGQLADCRHNYIEY